MSFSSSLYLSSLYCGFDCLCFSLHPTSHSQCCPVTLENWKLSHELSTTQLAAAGSKVETFFPTQSQLQISIVSCDGSQVDGRVQGSRNEQQRELSFDTQCVYVDMRITTQHTISHFSLRRCKGAAKATTHNLLPCLSLKWFWVFSSIRLLTHTFHFSDSDLTPSLQTKPQTHSRVAEERKKETFWINTKLWSEYKLVFFFVSAVFFLVLLFCFPLMFHYAHSLFNKWKDVRELRQLGEILTLKVDIILMKMHAISASMGMLGPFQLS